jgi:hypothetical protein
VYPLYLPQRLELIIQEFFSELLQLASIEDQEDCSKELNNKQDADLLLNSYFYNCRSEFMQKTINTSFRRSSNFNDLSINTPETFRPINCDTDNYNRLQSLDNKEFISFLLHEDEVQCAGVAFPDDSFDFRICIGLFLQISDGSSYRDIKKATSNIKSTVMASDKCKLTTLLWMKETKYFFIDN